MTARASSPQTVTDPSAPMTADDSGPASVRTVVSYGFWIFLISDVIMFSTLFAAYAVLSAQTAGGPGGHDLFDLRRVAIQTSCLLLSSYTCGLGGLALERRRLRPFLLCFAVTFLLGGIFLTLEVTEFDGMISRGAGPSRSAFLSAFFSLVGLHGIHVACGLLWLCFMVAQAVAKGPRPFILRRAQCFGLFWHTLDIIWVAIMSLVYLVALR